MTKSKKTIALMLAAAVLLLVSCSNKPADKGETPANADKTEVYKLGLDTWDSGTPLFDGYGDEAQHTAETAGMEVLRVSDEADTGKQYANIARLIAEGADALMFQGGAEQAVPQLAAAAKDAKKPFLLYTLVGDDKDREKFAETNSYYVGAFDEDAYRDGKLMGQAALSDGAKMALVIGGAVGSSTMDLKASGFSEAFRAGGGIILDEVRCTDVSECVTKTDDAISANEEVDTLYIMSGDYVAGVMSSLARKGMTGKFTLYMSGVDKASAELILQGVIKRGNDGVVLAAAIAPTLLLNYLDGHQILDKNGKPPHFQTVPFEVNQKNADEYLAVFYAAGLHPITDRVLRSLCFRYNTSVSYETYSELIENSLNLLALMDAGGIKGN
ncbi:MAG: substrate-binding domain-containing protein [Oscillospiraceae bacterium]|jgi:ABC-type sugar transport system substrate-binding protein|nr:substrate-binding domain-containing protein [Oscillospiraceae bacterium]